MENESLDIDIDDIPSGYVLMKKDDGFYTLLKMEPQDSQDEVDADEQQHEIIEEVIEEGDAAMEMILDGEVVEEEIDINSIPDIIEEDLPPDLSPVSIEHTVTNDQVEFIGQPIRSTSVDNRQGKSRSYGHTPNLWRGVAIPPNLTREEVNYFKSRHLLRQLCDRVDTNRQKVEVYEKKNDSLRALIYNQREEMTKMGFHVKDIIRYHNVRKKIDPGPRLPSPLMDPNLMSDLERLEYERKRKEAEYEHLRKRLKTLLCGYRRYKKIFVDNHEKIKKGPNPRRYTFYHTKKESMLMQHTSDSDSDPGSGKLKPYKCYHCRYGAETKGELRSHIEGHLSQKQYKCCVCSYFTSRITPFLEHMKSHPGAKAFRCKHCEFRTAHPAAMKNHEAIHLSVKPYECTICDFKAVRSDHLRTHMRRHKSDRNFKCERCPFTSKYSSGLSKHKKTAHGSNYVPKRKPYTEVIVEEDAESESDNAGETTEIEIDEKGKMLNVRHIGKSSRNSVVDELGGQRRSRRQNAKKVMSDYVEGDEFDEEDTEEDKARSKTVKVEKIMEDDAFTIGEIIYEQEDVNDSDVELNVNEESEQDESADGYEMQKPHKGKDLLNSYVIYQCVFCEFSCEMKHNLVTHLRSHMEYWSFTCKACNFTASNPSDLQHHTEVHKNEGEIQCSYCDHVASSKDKLRKHVEKRHAHGKPLACIYCDYISSSRFSMRAHMRGHKSKKVWQCLICNYKAEFRSGLKRHLKKHTGERPYHCPHCEFNAAQFSHLTRHLRKNHPNEPVLETRPASPFVIL